MIPRSSHFSKKSFKFLQKTARHPKRATGLQAGGHQEPGLQDALIAGGRASKTLTALMGHRVFLPDFLTYKWTLILLIAFLLVYYLLATWNEETDKITVEI